MRTQIGGSQVLDGSVQRSDLDATTPGKAVIRKIVAGNNVTITSTGPDSGTGDVVISASVNTTHSHYSPLLSSNRGNTELAYSKEPMFSSSGDPMINSLGDLVTVSVATGTVIPDFTLFSSGDLVLAAE